MLFNIIKIKYFNKNMFFYGQYIPEGKKKLRLFF